MLRLNQELLAAGFTTFHGLQVPAGGNWRTWWASKALNCKVVIPVLSVCYFESSACRAELTFAGNAGKRLVPVLQQKWEKGICPVDCTMLLQDSNRIPSSGQFEEDAESNLANLVEVLQRLVPNGANPAEGGLQRHSSATIEQDIVYRPPMPPERVCADPMAPCAAQPAFAEEEV